jgi:hypothetical protein
MPGTSSSRSVTLHLRHAERQRIFRALARAVSSSLTFGELMACDPVTSLVVRGTFEGIRRAFSRSGDACRLQCALWSGIAVGAAAGVA